MLAMDNKKIPLLALLTTLAIITSLLERFISLDFIMVGAKLGLANVVTIFVIYRIGRYEAFLLLFTRLLVVTLLSGRVSSLLFSLFGGLFSFAVCIILVKYYGKFVTFVGICIISAAFHHIGQILAGIIMLSSFSVIAYLPYLLLVSLPLGYITGSFLEILVARLEKITIK